MTGKGDRNERYRVHGDGLETIRQGFTELGMPDHRRNEAVTIVREVLEANEVVDFRWYMPPRTNEVCCYWGEESQNVLWVTVGDVHILNDVSRVKRPKRSFTWQKQGGDYVGWLLPGAERGTGGGKRSPEVGMVLCPKEKIQQPRGTVCQYCDIIHG